LIKKRKETNLIFIFKKHTKSTPLMLEYMSSWDLLIIAIYFGITLWIAWWASRVHGKPQIEQGSADYFLAGKNSLRTLVLK
jgi:uncharacterized membrane protein YedE/YeeE